MEKIIFDSLAWAKTQVRTDQIHSNGLRILEDVDISIIAKLNQFYKGDTDGITIQLQFLKNEDHIATIEFDDSYNHDAKILFSDCRITLVDILNAPESGEYIEGCISQVIASKAKLEIFAEVDKVVFRLILGKFATETTLRIDALDSRMIQLDQNFADSLD